jgi:uncharacterized membrane protein
VHYSGSAIICTGGGCETVQTSRYAEVAGVPVSLLGLLGYAAPFALSLARGETAHAGAIATSRSPSAPTSSSCS